MNGESAGQNTLRRCVLVAEPMHEAGVGLLESREDFDVVHLPDARPETFLEVLPRANAIAIRTAPLTRELLQCAPGLDIVSRHGVGCDSIDVNYLSGRGIPVAIATGANARSVAEHTMAMIMSIARQLPDLDGLVRSGEWARRNEYRAIDLDGANVLIVGFGRIGRIVARLCRAFGMDVTVADIALDRALADEIGCRPVEDFREALADADIVTLHVPLDETTRHLIGGSELDAMKDGGILINCARGGVVDEDALCTALACGKLRGAALDVLVDEPPSPDHPLLSEPKALLTPHNGAASLQASRMMAVMTARNIIDFYDGRLRDECVFNLADLR